MTRHGQLPWKKAAKMRALWEIVSHEPFNPKNGGFLPRGDPWKLHFHDTVELVEGPLGLGPSTRVPSHTPGVA
jgi:hypothetical protein